MCKIKIYLPFLLAALLLPGICFFFSGCYTLRQGTALLGYLSRAVPLERLDDPADMTGEGAKNREFARLVRDIRRFALEELGLSDTKNYTRYVALDRDYLALVVSASARDSFTRHEWRYPVVGRLPYKGFFTPEDARREAEKLRRKDLDVWVREVDAFSTLGWFRDPLYSYMRDYPVHRLADLLIHELFHATVFLKNWSQFNEELAEFAGGEGARLYIISRFGADSEIFREMKVEERDSAVFLSLVRSLSAELQALYLEDIPRQEKLARKAEIIRAFQESFAGGYENHFSGDSWRGFAKIPVNNAWLDLYRLYYGESSFFRDLYENSGGGLPAFIAAAKQLRGKEDPREELAALIAAGR